MIFVQPLPNTPPEHGAAASWDSPRCSVQKREPVPTSRAGNGSVRLCHPDNSSGTAAKPGHPDQWW